MRQLRLKADVTSPQIEVFTGVHYEIYTQAHKQPFEPKTEIELMTLLNTHLFELVPATTAEQQQQQQEKPKQDAKDDEQHDDHEQHDGDHEAAD
jgi:hypothetical protein